MPQHNVVVVGAGVAGLTTALLLSRSKQYDVVVIAKHMPGDYDIEFASPWAGASYMPVSARGTKAQEWDKKTWAPFEDLATNHPEAGVHFQDCELYNRAKDQGSATEAWFRELISPNPWYKDVVPGYGVIPENELPAGINFGQRYTSVCINTAIYLPWLLSQCLANGATFKRARLSHILDASSLHPSGKVHLVVNCTGLGAAKLGGVEDPNMVPIRGQIVLVRNEAPKMMGLSGTDDGADEACYMMTRAAGGGTVLGGSYQKGSWESQPDPNLATRIMKRALEVCPQLANGKGVEGLDVIRHGVGLRPHREGGIRLEKEKIGEVWVVHNYGAGGAGYQCSYGCADEVVGLVNEALGIKPKL